MKYTDSQNKYLEYILDLECNSDFRITIKKLRKILNIPRTGFENFTKLDKSKAGIFLGDAENSIQYLKRKYSNNTTDLSAVLEWKKMLSNRGILKDIVIKFNLPGRIYFTLYHYILYKDKNEIIKANKSFMFGCGHGCEIITRSEYDEKYLNLNKVTHDKDLVAVILVYPEAKPSDIKSVINNSSFLIRSAQINRNENPSSYVIRNIRTKYARSIHNKIINLYHEGHNYKEISQILKLKQENAWGYVRKIISDYKKNIFNKTIISNQDIYDDLMKHVPKID